MSAPPILRPVAPAPAGHRRRSLSAAVVVVLVGLLAAMTLPFAPVLADRATVTWPPVPAAAPVSTTAFFAPYRPATLMATVPCVDVARSAVGRVTLLATAPDGAGLGIRSIDGAVRVELEGRIVASGRANTAAGGTAGPAAPGGTAGLPNGFVPGQAAVPGGAAGPPNGFEPGRTAAPGGGTGLPNGFEPGQAAVPGGAAGLPNGPERVAGPADVAEPCGVRVVADERGVVIELGGVRTTLPGEPVPEVSAFRTDLTSAPGLTATATTATPWESSPTPLKLCLIVIHLLAVAIALGLLHDRRLGAFTRISDRNTRPADDHDPEAADMVGTVRPGARLRASLGRPAARLRSGVPPALARARLMIISLDAAVVAVFAGWAVIGPLSDDDGFAAAIAHNVASTGDAGNYYRWWNASEAPFALSYQLLAPLIEISPAPLWLRLPSTLLGIATWFVVSRGVLGVLAPGRIGVRWLAALFLTTAWLPLDLGIRSEPWVAFGTVTVLAVLLRARSPVGVGVAALLVGITVPISPTGILVLAPVLACHRRIRDIVSGRVRPVRAGDAAEVDSRAPGDEADDQGPARRGDGTAHVRHGGDAAPVGHSGSAARVGPGGDGAPVGHGGEAARVGHGDGVVSLGRGDGAAPVGHGDGVVAVAVRIGLLAVVASVVMTAVFADQTWHGVLAATGVHTGFGPALPWYEELTRYAYLLGDDADGAFAKRVPVLLTLALLVTVGVTLLRRGRDALGEGTAVLTVTIGLAFALLVPLPSKWSHHFGSLAGLIAPFAALAVVGLWRSGGRSGLLGALLAATAAAISFAGPNAWWQPVNYPVPWAAAPIRPAGLPLNTLLPWLALAALATWYASRALSAGEPGAVGQRVGVWGRVSRDLRVRESGPGRGRVGAAAGESGSGYARAGVVDEGGPHAPRRPWNSGRPGLLGGSGAGAAAVAVVAAGTSVAVLLGSFATAPLRRPNGYTLAGANLDRLTGRAVCALADGVQVLPDSPGGVLTPAVTVTVAELPTVPTGQPAQDSSTGPAGSTGQSARDRSTGQPGPAVPAGPGWLAGGGFRPDLIPFDPPGTATSRFLWGSRVPDDPGSVGELTSPWFALPALGTRQVALSVAGRIGAGTTLELEFGRAGVALGRVTPAGAGTVDPHEPPADDVPGRQPGLHPPSLAWRTVAVDAAAPAGADQVRIRAVDAATDPDGWLATSGPRLRDVIGLTDYLATRGGTVLVDWPIAFLLPCVRNRPVVADGLAAAPTVRLAAPSAYSGLADIVTSRGQGGSFLGVRTQARLAEVPSRLVGDPSLEWGRVQLVEHGLAVDAYRVDRVRVRVWGWQG